NLTSWAPTAASLCNPQGLATDNGGNLYIADTENGRLLKYNTPLTATNASASAHTTADAVLGKLDFVHGGANIVSARGLYFPLSVAVDTSVVPNHVYVTDSSNNRVLGWRDESRFVNGTAADMVLGQADFLSSAINRGGSPRP